MPIELWMILDLITIKILGKEYKLQSFAPWLPHLLIRFKYKMLRTQFSSTTTHPPINIPPSGVTDPSFMSQIFKQANFQL
jgi:hypothetical protein